MWRRVPARLQTLTLALALDLRRRAGDGAVGIRALASAPSSSPSPIPNTATLFSAESGLKRRVEDVMPIATGLEWEELAAELQGEKRFDMDAPIGPFGSKEAPAVIHSYYNKRIVGCPGGEGDDEHDVVWFWLEKGKPHECIVCSQYFALEVIGPGGPPDGHGDGDHH